jgi:hypothetical protein
MQYGLVDQFEKNEIGGECSKYGERKVSTGFWWTNLTEREYIVDRGIDGMTILRCISKTWNVG